MKVIVTGGAGFIGSAVCRHLVGVKGWQVVNVDKLTYAGNLASLTPIERAPGYRFVQADICDRAAIDRVLAEAAPDAIMHLAAESHVDRSITGSAAFIETNIVGTHTLLEAARAYWSGCRSRAGRASASFTSRPTRSTAASARAASSSRQRPTIRAHPIRPARRRPTIWSAPGTRPTACRR